VNRTDGHWTRLSAVLTVVCFVSGMMPYGAVRARPSGKRAPRTGTLKIICGIDGAQYVLDEGEAEAKQGTTPAEPIDLQAGPHTIRVSKGGYLPYSEVFDIKAGDVTELEVELVLYSGKLRVGAVPPPVEVQVDGQALGVAPMEIDLSIGEHVVRLSKPGYVEEIRRVAVKTGRTSELSVTLLPVAEVRKASGGGPIHKKWWFWTVLVTVAAGVVIPSVLLTRKGSKPADRDVVLELP